MGKNTDRLYITAKEWSTEHGGFKKKGHLPYQRLPFNCCAIAFTPFQDPVCTEDGTVYDITNIVPYIQKHHKHPVTGQPLDLQDLIPLTFHTNSDGEYHCPILAKVFTQHSHIVAVKTSGNVFSYEAIQELNAKTKSWRDLITDEPFTRKDVIHIQDPMQLAKRELANFDHVKKDIDISELLNEDEPSVIRHASATMQKVMETLKAATGKDIHEPNSRRALAMAQVEEALKQKRSSSQKGKGQKGGQGGKADAPVSAAVAATADDDDDDWRMKAPAATRTVIFKPGASTWDTDDHEESERKLGKKAVAERKRKELQDAKEKKGKLVPQMWWHENYKPRYELSVETTGAASRSFTSTSQNVVTTNERIQKLVHRNPTKKAYCQLQTNKGSLNLELHCDLVPRTCENFLTLCEMGYYNNTKFHRSIRNFMIQVDHEEQCCDHALNKLNKGMQGCFHRGLSYPGVLFTSDVGRSFQGGDPTGTGEGGESIYGKTFADELDSRLNHDGRGVLAMANSGKDTNGSQFFILYKSARHLDFKHTVFGRVVGGLETLTAMENVKTSDTDRPLEDLRITGCQVYGNPYRELLEEEEKEATARKEKEDMEQKGIIPDSERAGKWFSDPRSAAQSRSTAEVMGPPPERVTHSTQVGVYIKRAAVPEAEAAPVRATKKAKPLLNSEFDAW